MEPRAWETIRKLYNIIVSDAKSQRVRVHATVRCFGKIICVRVENDDKCTYATSEEERSAYENKIIIIYCAAVVAYSTIIIHRVILFLRDARDIP